MAKGDGSITEVRRGVWRVRVDFGTDPATRKRNVVSRNVSGTKAEARRVRDEIRREHDYGLVIDGDKMAFGEFALTWIDARETSGDAGKARISLERTIIKTLTRYIGETPLRELTPRTVESLYATIKRDKIAERGRYSGTTLKGDHQLLKQILQKAVDYDYILRNPCDRVKAPRAEEPERKALTIEQAAQLLRCINQAEEEAYSAFADKETRQTERGNLFGRSAIRGLKEISNITAVRLGLATGMRRGEVFGLCWGSVDTESGHISVIQSLTDFGELKPPKSKAGVRTVSIDTHTTAHLKQWKKRQAIELLKLGITQRSTTPVCCTDTGTQFDLHNFGRWWRLFRSDYGFESLRFHELRHTQATQLLANGVDVKTVQTRLGHSNASITLNWYAHSVQENDDLAAELVGNLFETPLPKPRIIEVKTA